MPVPNAHGGFSLIVTSLTRPVSAAGVPPEAILHGNLQQIVTAPPVPGIVTGWKSRQRTKAPLAKGGWFGEAKPGGFRRLAGFHIGLYYRKVPAVESLSQKSKIFASSLWQGSLAACRRCQFRTGIFCESLLPLQCPVSLLRCSRCIDQSPPCQRGVVWRSQTGGIPQVGRLPHRFILSESACCRIPQSKIKDFCQLPLAREPFFTRYRSIVRYRAFFIFQSTAWEESSPKPPQT